MSAVKEKRNKMLVLSIKAGESVGGAAKTLGIAKSTASVIWNRDKDKYGRKNYRSPEPVLPVRSYPQEQKQIA